MKHRAHNLFVSQDKNYGAHDNFNLCNEKPWRRQWWWWVRWTMLTQTMIRWTMMTQTIMRGLLPPDRQHQAEDRALEDAEEEAEIFETEVFSSFSMIISLSAAAEETAFLISSHSPSSVICWTFNVQKVRNNKILMILRYCLQVNFLFALFKKGRMPRSYLRWAEFQNVTGLLHKAQKRDFLKLN